MRVYQFHHIRMDIRRMRVYDKLAFHAATTSAKLVLNNSTIRCRLCQGLNASAVAHQVLR